MPIAYIGLGGNIGDIESRMRSALKMLDDAPIMSVSAISSVYRTTAVGGPSGQPDYLNAVARMETERSPQEILSRMLEVERRLGRVRNDRWGPRTIDLDLLLYGDEVLDEPGLSLPHPRMRERLFVLEPMTDIAPAEMRLPPDGTLLGEIVQSLRNRETDRGAVTKVFDFTERLQEQISE